MQAVVEVITPGGTAEHRHIQGRYPCPSNVPELSPSSVYPQRDLGVEEQSHDSPRSARATSASTSFVKAASIRAWLTRRDRHDPRRRKGAIGTSFAIGLPLLAITISSPAAAALTSLES